MRDAHFSSLSGHSGQVEIQSSTAVATAAIAAISARQAPRMSGSFSGH
jgi:hypothetical protein